MENKTQNFIHDNEITLGLPCYNEEKNISIVLEDCVNLLSSHFSKWEILVVDNNSSDKTIEVVDRKINQFSQFNGQIKIIKNEKNILYSGSSQKIYDNAKYRIIAMMDSDNQYNPKDIIKCYNSLISNNYDLIFGYRKKRKDGTFRNLVSLIFNLIISILIKCNLNDINCGLKILKKYKEINFLKNLNHINPEIYICFLSDSKKIGEVEIDHKHRDFGESVNTFTGIAKSFMMIIIYLFKLRKKYF